MIKPKLLDLDLEGNYTVSNGPVMSTIIGNLLLPNEQFYKISKYIEWKSTTSIQFYNAVCIEL